MYASRNGTSRSLSDYLFVFYEKFCLRAALTPLTFCLTYYLYFTQFMYANITESASLLSGYFFVFYSVCFYEDSNASSSPLV